MFLKSLSVRNFRGLGNALFEWQEGVNIIVGQNNTGKTAILDALRLCLGIGSEQRDVFVGPEDYHISPTGDVARTIEFDLIWADLTDEEKGIFSEMLAISPDGRAELQLHLRFDYDPSTEKTRRVYWGGEKQGQAISPEVLDLFDFTHLGALRDATRDLGPGRGNQLSKLLLKLASKPKSQQRLAKEINDKIQSVPLWRKLLERGKKRINEHLAEVSLKNAPQEINIDFVESQFRQIVEGLRIQVPIRSQGGQQSIFNIWQNSLGYNNLIYIATVLGDLLKRRDRMPYASISLLIEEPEAHLHPQLQNVLFRYLEKIERQKIQVFISSHSPTITARTDLDSLVMLTPLPKGITSTPLRSLGLERKHKQYLERFLDVTKCQLFFADSVILVEGMSEALLLPCFARALGEDFDLDKNAVEVVNVGGVAFESFARLFNAENAAKRINVRCALITDDDRQDVSPSQENEISSRAEKAKGLEGELLKVFLATKTFEYELFYSNEEIVTSIYRELHPQTEIAFVGITAERAMRFAEKVAGNKDKALLAQEFARKVEDDRSISVVVPDYIANAIRWVTRGEWENPNASRAD